MDAKANFSHFLTKNELINRSEKVLLAVSGGKDSMLMLHLMHDLGYQISIAHCNFQLRGKESDLDEGLVRNYALQHQIPFHVIHFDTEEYADKHKISIQMAARELRYEWFEQLRTEFGYGKIAIAQHLNDHIETSLFNLTRSTGLKGLLGISIQRDHLIRPLMCFIGAEVEKIVKDLQVPYRDDQSNFSSKYARNKIRLEIIPKFKEIQPDFEQIFLENIKHFEESYQFIQRIVSERRKELFRVEGKYVYIQRADLSENLSDSYFLFELFKPFGFQKSILEEMIAVWDKPMGQVFESSDYELLMDRDQLIIRKRSGLKKEQKLLILEDNVSKHLSAGESVSFPFLDSYLTLGRLRDLGVEDPKSSKQNTNTNTNENGKSEIQIDADLLQFPLKLRFKEQGDYFIPLGMTGRKKLSDFFIQEKVNRFEKEEIPILVNGNGEIIWVVGMRLDNRYKVTENTKKVLTLVFK